MAKAKKAAGSGDAKPIADVAHPGTTAPTDTSKSIITHRLMVKDPMVVEEDAKLEDTGSLPKKTSELKIAPPTEPVTNDDPAPVEPETPAAEKAPEPAETEEPKSADEDKKSLKAPKSDKDIKAAEAAKDAKLQQLIDSKKYSLPINAVEQRRSKRVVTLGIVLAILLALAWVNIALDAGLIHLDNIKPLTHFFSS